MRDHCVPDLVESWLGIMVSMVCMLNSSDSLDVFDDDVCCQNGKQTHNVH